MDGPTAITILTALYKSGASGTTKLFKHEIEALKFAIGTLESINNVNEEVN